VFLLGLPLAQKEADVIIHFIGLSVSVVLICAVKQRVQWPQFFVRVVTSLLMLALSGAWSCPELSGCRVSGQLSPVTKYAMVTSLRVKAGGVLHAICYL
jgi:hypothetical protein